MPDVIEGESRLILPASSVATTTSIVATCGNCRFRQNVVEDLQILECHGLPPTPVIMGMGQTGPAVGLLRPRLPRTEKACALHKPDLAGAL